MYNDNSNPTLTNCTFSRNTRISSGEGGAMFNTGTSLATLINCVLWNNGDGSGDEIFDDADETTIVAYSNIEGGWPGFTNFDLDPLFVDAANDNLRLLPGSPCIDSGTNSALPQDINDLDNDGDTTEPIPFDLDGNSRLIDDPLSANCPQITGDCSPPVVDMGAYEFEPQK